MWLLKKDTTGLATKIWFWEEGYHGEEIYSEDFFMTKLTGVASDYIHMNPVRAGIVQKEEEYLNSSCGDYYGTRIGPLLLEKL